MKSKSKIIGGDISKHQETIKTINGELHRIYGLVNSVEVKNTSKKQIEEIRDDLHELRRRLKKYCGD